MSCLVRNSKPLFTHLASTRNDIKLATFKRRLAIKRPPARQVLLAQSRIYCTGKIKFETRSQFLQLLHQYREDSNEIWCNRMVLYLISSEIFLILNYRGAPLSSWKKIILKTHYLSAWHLEAWCTQTRRWLSWHPNVGGCWRCGRQQQALRTVSLAVDCCPWSGYHIWHIVVHDRNLS